MDAEDKPKKEKLENIDSLAMVNVLWAKLSAYLSTPDFEGNAQVTLQGSDFYKLYVWIICLLEAVIIHKYTK